MARRSLTQGFAVPHKLPYSRPLTDSELILSLEPQNIDRQI